jgi:hypothetical protein
MKTDEIVIMKSEVPQIEAVAPKSILQMAIAQGADIDKLTKLLELQERWEANEARKAFHAAMAKFKDNPPKIGKNKHVKFTTQKGVTEYDHSTLGHVVDQIAASLASVGMSHKWKTTQQGSNITVTCILTHELGHSEDTSLTAGADDSGGKNSIQAVGSTVTYLERYTLLAATGTACGIDDDGRASEASDADEDFDQHMDRSKAKREGPKFITKLKADLMRSNLLDRKVDRRAVRETLESFGFTSCGEITEDKYQDVKDAMDGL